MGRKCFWKTYVMEGDMIQWNLTNDITNLFASCQLPTYCHVKIIRHTHIYSAFMLFCCLENNKYMIFEKLSIYDIYCNMYMIYTLQNCSWNIILFDSISKDDRMDMIYRWSLNHINKGNDEHVVCVMSMHVTGYIVARDGYCLWSKREKNVTFTRHDIKMHILLISAMSKICHVKGVIQTVWNENVLAWNEWIYQWVDGWTNDMWHGHFSKGG